MVLPKCLKITMQKLCITTSIGAVVILLKVKKPEAFRIFNVYTILSHILLRGIKI